jgi:hypothetical protein
MRLYQFGRLNSRASQTIIAGATDAPSSKCANKRLALKIFSEDGPIAAASELARQLLRSEHIKEFAFWFTIHA